MIAPYNASSIKTPKKSKSKRMIRGVVFSAVILTILLSVVYVFLSESKNDSTTLSTKEDTPKRKSKYIKNKTHPSTIPHKQSNNESEKDFNKKHEVWLGKPVVKHEYKTNNTLVVETIYTVDGKKHKYYHDERENVLPTGADQILAMMTANNNFGAPPLPRMKGFENDFAEALKTPIEIKDSDSPSIKEIKKRVILARKEMLDLIAEGYSADEVIQNWERMQEDNATIRMEAVRLVKTMLSEGDREGAKLLCEKYNEVLSQAGIMKIELPNK